MADDVRTDAEPEEEDEAITLVHDDIAARLLEYQRQLREGAPNATPDDRDVDEVIDLTALEADAAGPEEVADVIDITTGQATGDERLAAMERRLERLSRAFTELRSSFQDMAVSADEKLGRIEELLADLRRQRH